MGDQATSNKPVENEIQSSQTIVVNEILSLEKSASFILVDSIQMSESQSISKSYDTPPNHSESSASIIQASAESVSLESAETATPILEHDLSSGIDISSITDVTESSPQPTVVGDAPSPTPVTAPPQSASDTLPITDETEPGGKQEEDFPSFTEWTQKVLAEQEKTKQESQSSSGQANTATTSQKKLRNNYASNSCGAKILATNPEAENVKHVLTSNKDEYMINPCSAKKWFLVELCEPVQVKMVEMASLELFSSQPKSFRVFISDRYPAKEWQSLGVYEAKDERVIQTFHTTNDQFVKYIKVEMIEHYGNEHFCPITLFRLYGLPIADDDENDNDEQNLQTETDIESGKLVENDEEENKDGARNLFMSAKDTVVNLVKKVLNVDDGTKKDLDQDNNITGLHVDSNKNLSADGTILPCVPVILSGSEDELPTVLVPTPTIKETTVATGSETVDVPIVTKLDDDEQIPSSHIDNVMLDIHQCFNVTPTTSSHKLLCSYINTMLMLRSSATPVCLKDDNIVSSLSDEQTTQVDMVTTDKPFERIVTSLKEGSIESNLDRFVETPESQSELFESMQTVAAEDGSTQTMSSIESSRPSDKTPSSILTEDIATHSESPVVNDHTSLDLSVSQTSDQGETTPITLEPSSTDIGAQKVEETETKTKVLDITKTTLEGLDIVEQTKMESKATSDILEPTTSQLFPDAISPTIEVSKTETVMSSHKVVEPATPIVKPVVGVGEKVLEVTDKELKKPKDLDLVKVPLGSIAKRETAIMRLTNRIKALELNVSLSSRFLEELSQRFKKQNEEIMKLMNKTIARLNNSTRESEIHDIQQQRQLDILESRIDNLTSIVDNLAKNMEALTNKISDRQMVWTSVEFVILMIVCVVCLLRGRPVTISPELKQLLETMPKQPNPTMLQRRNSVDMGAMSHNRPASTIRKNASETTLVDPCLVNSTNITSHPETHLLKEGVRRKKKKKFKSVESKSTTFLHEKSKQKDQSSPVEISREAGILFGADAVNTLTGLGIQEVDPGPVSSSSSTVSLPAQCSPHPFIESCKENGNSIQQVESQKYYSTNKSSVGIRTSGKQKKHNRPLSNGTSDIIIETIKPVLTKQKEERKQSLPSELNSLKENRGHKSRVSWLF
ncbi:SUN domain-containing ossification factor isoform X2 [Patella vulgata]|uniref:SUN domain-containing ossification factor isoform X2 n=1 Tax=Patella vulgata TaxID=6465 RepID=UPI00217FFB4C|nr:SUN domain-containing ossification factor isoform X2 [Patella vulgata]